MGIGGARARIRIACAAGLAILAGWATVHAVRWKPPLAVPDNDHMLFQFSTAAGAGHFERTFSSNRAIAHCHIAVIFAGRGDRVRLSLLGPNGASFQGLVGDGTQFGWGRDFPPEAPVSIAVDQGANHGGVTVFIADQAFAREGLNGWQILCRIWVVLFFASGLLAWANRRSLNPKRKLLSAYVFKMLALALSSMFFYLLFHEGGHAVTSEFFGGNGFTRSDFWGIHGSPHAGGSSDSFKPWQRAVTSFAGPAAPTLVGWLLFLWWRSRGGQTIRLRHAVLDLFLTCLTAFLTLPFAVVVGPMMMGLISDGDWRGFIGNVPGPRWQVYLFLIVSVLVSVFILWRTLPHVYVLVRMETERIRHASSRCAGG